ncbi:Cyclic nucleotide-binding protein [Pseudocohnilembus persalinus]|uniref:Cyclic nucleotide-binding protein n=1 Tax=Pseudocohnilembus persalinus TaxID=266149 RepID=A0A0V0R2Q7_PSEPJ|nr:Cyclic nucleotide-binding protein [Pseudocohnilembus persalinus]|eukprot:KRX08618.1 Cyclic nucleotide-binding protein [Pseudocohnilembus persalinus]
MLVGPIGYNYIEVAFTTIILFTTVGFFAYILNTISQIIFDLNKSRAEYLQEFKAINRYMKEKQTSKEIQSKVRNYLEYYFRSHESQTQNNEVLKILEKLPKILRDEMLYEINSRRINQFKKITQHFSQKTIDKITSQFEETSRLPSEIIFKQDDNNEDEKYLYWIKSGQVELYVNLPSNSKRTLKLCGKGEFIGQYAFFTNLPYNYNAKCLQTCIIYKIKKKTLYDIANEQDEDKQKLVMIKDEILFKGFTSHLSQLDYCIVCTRRHAFDICPQISYQPNLRRLVAVNNRNIIQERNMGEKQKYERGRMYKTDVSNALILYRFRDDIYAQCMLNQELRIQMNQLTEKIQQYNEELDAYYDFDEYYSQQESSVSNLTESQTSSSNSDSFTSDSVQLSVPKRKDSIENEEIENKISQFSSINQKLNDIKPLQQESVQNVVNEHFNFNSENKEKHNLAKKNTINEGFFENNVNNQIDNRNSINYLNERSEKGTKNEINMSLSALPEQEIPKILKEAHQTTYNNIRREKQKQQTQQSAKSNNSQIKQNKKIKRDPEHSSTLQQDQLYPSDRKNKGKETHISKASHNPSTGTVISNQNVQVQNNNNKNSSYTILPNKNVPAQRVPSKKISNKQVEFQNTNAAKVEQQSKISLVQSRIEESQDENDDYAFPKMNKLSSNQNNQVKTKRISTLDNFTTNTQQDLVKSVQFNDTINDQQDTDGFMEGPQDLGIEFYNYLAEIMEQREAERALEEAVLNSKANDIEYTLEIHAPEAQKEVQMSQFFRKRAKQISQDKQIKEREARIKDKEHRQKIQSRLYSQKSKPPEYPEDIKKRQKEEKKKAQQLSKDELYLQNQRKQKIEQERNEFVQNLIIAHKTEKPEETKYKNIENLENFYLAMTVTEQEKYKLPQDKQQVQVRNDLKIYFDLRAQDMRKIHKMKQGYDTRNSEDILNVWKNKTTDLEKKKFQLEFEDEQDAKKCLNEHLEELDREEKAEEERRKQEEEEKERREEEKIQQIQKNMDKKFQKLAKPKDRLKLGKQMLILKQMFPKDKYLRNLILQEFRDTKLAKFPEEYDVYDSDEENMIKQRNQTLPVTNLKELDKPLNEKQIQIQELFKKFLEEQQLKKKQAIEKQRELTYTQKINDQKLESFLRQKAKEFIELRNQRLDQLDEDNEDESKDNLNDDQKKNEKQAFTLKKFLEKTYKEMINSSHKEATNRNFPHYKWGQSKKLRQRSYPNSFKRKFFQVVKRYIREQSGAGKLDKKEKLPFWAPGGDSRKCLLHDKTDCPKNCKYISANKRIWELSSQNIQAKEWEKKMFYFDKQIREAEKKGERKEVIDEIKAKQAEHLCKGTHDQISAWTNNDYQKERENIMLTYTEAKECTFTPNIGIPRQGRTFEEWVEKFGENFKKSQPRIFKLGVLKQCQLLIQQKDYLGAYSKLSENFNVEQIKEHYCQEEGKTYKMLGTDSQYNYGKDSPAEQKRNMPNENFEDPNNKTILSDVYTMVTFLEKYEQQQQKKKNEIQKMLNQDIFAPHNPLLTKSANFSQSKMGGTDFDKTQPSMMTTMSTYDSRRGQIKSFMCPLGKNCPKLTEGRWPQSYISATVPIGAQCEFAHTYAELKFEQELHQKRKLLQNNVKNLQQWKNPKQKAWNPAGASFKPCSGCGGSKQKCATCLLKEQTMKSLEKGQKLIEEKEYYLKKYNPQHYDNEIKKKQQEDNDQQEPQKKQQLKNLKHEMQIIQNIKRKPDSQKEDIITDIQRELQRIEDDINQIESQKRRQLSDFQQEKERAEKFQVNRNDDEKQNQLKNLEERENQYKKDIQEKINLKQNKQQELIIEKRAVQDIIGKTDEEVNKKLDSLQKEIEDLTSKLEMIEKKRQDEIQHIMSKKKKDEQKRNFYFKKDTQLKQIIEQKQKDEQKLTYKQGQLQKANILYKQERYSEAFQVICKSVEIVKVEMEEKAQKEKEEDKRWLEILGLQPDQEITAELVFQTLNNNSDDPDQQQNGQVLYQYAQKRGIIGQKPPDVNQFINIQIEECYLKIEKKLSQKERDIILMKEKIEKLEGEDDQDMSETLSKTKKKDIIDHKTICPNIKQMGRCPDYEAERQQKIWQHQGWGDLKNKEIEKKCKYSHYPIELYLEKNESKINNLTQSIKRAEQQIIKSEKPQPYKPSSAQSVIMDVNEWREKERERELSKPSNQQKKSKIDKAKRSTIWEKETEELTTPFHERPKKQF